MTAFDETIVSDLHKDARGYRPRDVWWTYWTNCSDAEKQRVWATHKLMSLAEQFKETEARLEKKVDTA